jgi:glutamate dehydrogenase
MNNPVEEQTSSRKKTYLLNRLKELRQFFAGKTKSANGHSSDQNSYLEKLLANAPTSFLSSKDNSQLALIEENLNEFISNIASAKKAYWISKSKDNSGIFIGLSDRPFIVSSISECCSSLGINIDALLHPAIEINGITYSINFVVVDKVTDELLTSLERTIQILTSVTDNFSAITNIVKKAADSASSANYYKHFSKAENLQVNEFLTWLLDDSFIFLGSAIHSVTKDSSNSYTINALDQKNTLGLLSFVDSTTAIIKKEIDEDLRSFTQLGEPLWLTKFRESSPIHRRVKMSHLQVALCDDLGELTSILSLVGIFSSKAVSQEGIDVPLIKRKLDYLLQETNVVRGSHDYKSISDTLGRMPKEEAIRLSRAGLLSIIEQTIEVTTQLDPKVIVRFDTSKRGASILVILPQNRYSDEVRLEIGRALCKFFNVTADDLESYVDSSSHSTTKLYYHAALSFSPTENYNLDLLNNQIQAISEDFEGTLSRLVRANASLPSNCLNFVSAFDHKYKATYTANQALEHIKILTQLSESNRTAVTLATHSNTSGSGAIEIISRGKDFKLSEFLPVLEHAGFTVVKDSSFTIGLADSISFSIHKVEVDTSSSKPINLDYFNNSAKPALEEILDGRAEHDVLTSLSLTTGLNSRQVQLMRSLCSYLWQLGAFPRKHQIREGLADNPLAASTLWKIFDLTFNPNLKLSSQEKSSQVEVLTREYQDIVRQEKDISKDRILRSLLTVVRNILRTNYYIDSAELAFKVNCEGIDFMPEPKPWREIFVHSFDVEGIHLRTGAVSRGGLRWSERPDDFRTEVLGLVKTQKVKNVFIVPEGAKGGFFVRRMPSDSSKVADAVRNTYIKFIRALISLADNQIDGKICPPSNVVRLDNDDPYFVVAADKGTATFSDTANNIAVNEVGFWLDDAFASGGSNGYDHKVYGITAKGGWECVLRHFNDLGINYLTDTFTAVGIGDMAGDVFGNGLLLSQNLKLLGAFNHRHIFIDPTPDPKVSFQERKRLFELPRSQWSDYNQALISKGGGVFERSAKEITLSAEAKQALGIDTSTNVLSGEELIQAILKAPVDLLWNGGIGTYIKASSETNAQVNDSGNDPVRISATDLRCKIIGEGGNLGLTQRARVEFARLGGRLNTDAIDNSGGVGLSDKEVNLKILFSGLIRNKKITRDERNVLLKQMAEESCEHVLHQNREHAYRLTMSSQRSVIQHEFFRGFISAMEQKGYLNRALDGLPQDDELYQRLTVKNGLYRPELAICLAATKMWIKRLILESSLLKAKCLEPLLINYFPTLLRERFKNEILQHPLRDTIIATQATNLIVDTLGISFFYRLTKNGNAHTDTALKASLVALLSIDTVQILADLRVLDKPGTAASYLSSRAQFEQSLRAIANWIVLNAKADTASLDDLIAKFGPIISNGTQLEYFQDKPLKDEHLAEELNVKTKMLLRSLPRVANSLEVLCLSDRRKIPVDKTLSFMKAVKESLGITGREYLKDSIQPSNRWEYTLRKQSLSDIDKALVGMVEFALNNSINSGSELSARIEGSPSYTPTVQSINELTNISPSVAHFAVIARQLKDFVL